MHGSVARQVSRGLAGVFLVRGELDQIPEIADAPEAVLVLQDFDLARNGLPLEPGLMERMTGREGDLVTVNGQVNPQFAFSKTVGFGFGFWTHRAPVLPAAIGGASAVLDRRGWRGASLA